MNNTPVGRPGWIGNPYPESEYGRDECIELFRADFLERLDSDPEFRDRVEDLRGETLGCYCRPKPCHGDVILAYLRAGRSAIVRESDDDLRTDGGEPRTTREERHDEYPPFVDATAEYAECHFCGQTWEPTAVDGFDLSTEEEYYPKMVPVCPEHAGGCR